MANHIDDATIEYVGILAKLELSGEEKEQAKKDMAEDEQTHKKEGANLRPLFALGGGVPEKMPLFSGHGFLAII